MRYNCYLIAITALSSLLAPAAWASSQPEPLTDDTAPAFSDAGTMLGTQFSATFSNLNESGTVYERVYQKGGLINFYYQVSNDPASQANPDPDSISRLTVGNFKGFQVTGADYLQDTGKSSPTVTADIAPFSADMQTNGSSVGFNFGDQFDDIAPGATSDWVEVLTNAISHNFNGTMVVSDGSSSNITGNPGPAPEPSTWALLGVGLLAVLATARRQRSSLQV